MLNKKAEKKYQIKQMSINKTGNEPTKTRPETTNLKKKTIFFSRKLFQNELTPETDYTYLLPK